jgi:hypothetical protein
MSGMILPIRKSPVLEKRHVATDEGVSMPRLTKEG